MLNNNKSCSQFPVYAPNPSCSAWDPHWSGTPPLLLCPPRDSSFHCGLLSEAFLNSLQLQFTWEAELTTACSGFTEVLYYYYVWPVTLSTCFLKTQTDLVPFASWVSSQIPGMEMDGMRGITERLQYTMFRIGLLSPGFLAQLFIRNKSNRCTLVMLECTEHASRKALSSALCTSL